MGCSIGHEGPNLLQCIKFDGGVQNMKIVTAIPAEAITSPEDSDSSRSSSADFHPTGAMMQILYPENSINPAQKPQGGAEFYASPIDISDARNVTLEYSVFFPFDFDWVLAGKLPGLYGGHEGCSAGMQHWIASVRDSCGEREELGNFILYVLFHLYLTSNGSVSDTYGLSIGRGAFSWKAGAWTTVKQTVYLNTPGEQDGTFALDVDGERAIYREDVFYREDLTADKEDSKHRKTNHIPTKTSTKKHADPPSSTDDGGLLGPILGGILGRPLLRSVAEEAIVSFYRPGPTSTQDTDNDDEGSFMMVDAVLPRPTPNHPEQTNVAATLEDGSTSGTESIKVAEVKFAGIFFSTFFGGHDEKYATPKDQYVWFKDFALAYNS
ncbi:hypothetical protein CPB84DRAFT_1847814 [Gymnopilus junonius]|uniref:Polysaccharide lyase 14 domain-containing protein n=1 Tax=Gymnopilus junonius TaxID=109634 RepID=A0A9P5NPC1_GYMJU|nr:hypothetical protein CPB84DRAFT_1847814 [Gymnopilus junonius]